MKKQMTVQELGRMGGNATFKKLGKKHMRAISKMAIAARWKKNDPSVQK